MSIKIHCIVTSSKTFALDSYRRVNYVLSLLYDPRNERSACIVLLGVCGDVFQGFQNSSWYRMRGRKVFTLWLEAILVGDVAQGNRNPVSIRITVGSLNDDRRIRVVKLFQLTVFLYLDAISSLVVEGVRAVWVGSIGGVRQDRNRCVVVHRRGERGNRDDGENSARLENRFFIAILLRVDAYGCPRLISRRLCEINFKNLRINSVELKPLCAHRVA